MIFLPWMEKQVINFVSGPRNISTAIMYSFAQRSDTEVVDEPWYVCYLTHCETKHPGKEEIMKSQSADPELVRMQLSQRAARPITFIKNMAHHMIDLPLSYWQEYQNVFLIRNPHDLITSFAQVIPEPSMLDIGVKAEWELYDALKKKTGKNPIVIDSGELLKAPEKVLDELCRQLKLAFQPEMLTWPAGGRAEDGVWAKYWYKNVHQSTGFSQQRKKQRPMPSNCQALYEEAMKYYKVLFEESIKA